MNNDIPQGYKDSPLGVIPQEWEVKRLGEVCSRIGDGIHGTPKYVHNSDYIFINGNNLVAGKIKVGDDAKFVSKEEYEQNNKDLDDKTILLSINGTIGNIALYSGEKVMLGKSAAYLKFKNNVTFYFQLLQGKKIQSSFTKELSGSTIKNLSLKSIRETSFPLPPLPEQQRIAEVLGTWDVAIEKQGALVDKLTERKRALMQQLLTAKKRLPNFSEPWETVRLGDLAEIKTGKLDANSAEENGIYPFFTCGKTPFKINSFAFDVDAILVAGNGEYLGYVHHYKGKFNAYQRTYVIWGFKEDISFIKYYLMQFLPARITKTKSKGNTPYIVLSTLFDMAISLPTLPEQTAIAQILTTADREIEGAKAKLESLRSQKRGLMQQLLSGKKRIKI